MTLSVEVVRTIVARAVQRCEYCRMHQALQGAAFHIDHVVPSSRGGPSTLDNLALACPGCNLHKSDRIEVPDPDSSAAIPLFNPRTDRWEDHFAWEGYRLTGLTVVGKATIFSLDLNHLRRLRIRQAEELFGMFPP